MFRRLPYLVPFVLVLVAVPLVTHAQVVNLLEDPSFENEIIIGNTAWNRWLTWAAGGAVNSTVEIDKTEFSDGEKSLRVNPSGTGQFVVIYAAIPLEVGERYTVSFWAKAEAPRTVQARLQAMNNSSMETADFQLTTEWAEYTFTAEAPNASIKLQIQWNASVEVPYWLDFVSLYAGEYVAGIEPLGWSRVKAADPDPADGAADVPRDVVLGWTPGEYADLHDVYFGTSFDDVNNATATVDLTGVYRGRLSDSSYAVPEHLDLGETYYWRVDEVNAPPDSTVFKGDVWSFTTEPVGYPVDGANITVTASSSMAGFAPEKTIDGSGLDDSDLHSTSPEDMWLSDMLGSQPTWIEYQFDKVYKLHEMSVWNQNQIIEPSIGYGFKDVSIEYSADGIAYTTLGTTHEFARGPGAAGYAANTNVDFGGAAAKYVKLTVNSGWESILTQYGLSEVSFLYLPIWAREPSPDSGATDADVNAFLSFGAGREASEHDVYFSSDMQTVIDETISPVRIPAGSSSASYDPGALDLNQTYYWKVNEVNEARSPATWQGDVWSFTTQEYLVVDDFESYNDINEGEPGSNRIYLAWVDGFDNPAINGSVVGHPFAEQTIVHGGLQSMPFAFDNAVGKSEATLTLTNQRDWTVNGVNTLTIWLRGDAANAAEPLYVVLNGNALVTNDNPNAAQESAWTEWNIDLQAFADQGVNLANVDSITLGLGNRSNSVAGGAGMIFFDDIRISRLAP